MNYSLSPEVNILKKQLSFLARSIRKSQIMEGADFTVPQLAEEDTFFFAGEFFKRKRILLLSRGCSVATCTMCPLPNEAIYGTSRAPTEEDLMRQFDAAFAETPIDEYTRECLAILVKRHIKSQDVIDQLFELFIFRGIPEHIRSDNGPEFAAKAVRKWLARLGVKTLFIEPGSPWENGYIESFNGKLRDELLNREVFYTLQEAKVLIEQWRQEYNQVRPHSALRYQPPAPEAKISVTLT